MFDEANFDAIGYNNDMLYCAAKDDWDRAKELAGELLVWLDNGGLWPHAGKRAALVRAECKVILNNKKPAIIGA